MDVEKYYDSLDALLVCRWLESRGVPRVICACTLRHQLLPQVLLSVSGACIPIHHRTIGALTGSRVAGALGRIPVEATIADRALQWRQHGFQTDSSVLTVCIYIDNVFSVGRTLHGAISILEDFEFQLKQKWRLSIKSSSRGCLVPRGSLELPMNESKWPLQSSFQVLGHILENNGSTSMCWRNTRRSMWKAFFANSRKCLRPKFGLQLLQRAVLPCLDFRNTRWPAHSALSLNMDRVQRQMVASILRPQMLSGESPEVFVRRRNRVSAAEARRMGSWSLRHCKRVLSWRDHLLRPANSRSWAALLYQFRGFEWLLQRRSQNSGGLLAGRTGTRIASGNVSTRWHDGIIFAEQHLEQRSERELK